MQEFATLLQVRERALQIACRKPEDVIELYEYILRKGVRKTCLYHNNTYVAASKKIYEKAVEALHAYRYFAEHYNDKNTNFKHIFQSYARKLFRYIKKFKPRLEIIQQKIERRNATVAFLLKKLQKQIAIKNEGLLHSVILQYHIPKNLTKQDLLANGMIGMYRAIDGYDPKKGTAFSTYAIFHIKEKIQALFKSENKYYTLHTRSLNEGVKNKDGEEEKEIITFIPSRSPSPEEIVEKKYLLDYLQKILDDREFLAISMLMDGVKLSTIAKELSTNVATLYKIIERAIDKTRGDPDPDIYESLKEHLLKTWSS